MIFFPADAPGLLEGYRLAWIGGRYGSYKSALAFALALWLLQRDRSLRLFSPTASVVVDEFGFDEVRNSIFLLDEGGEYLWGRESERLLIGLRRYNCYVLLPSVKPPPAWARQLSFFMEYDLFKLGLPFCVYAAHLQFYREKFRFLFDPRPILGIYGSFEDARIDFALAERMISHWASFVRGGGGTKDKDDGIKEFDREDESVFVAPSLPSPSPQESGRRRFSFF